MDDAQDRKQQLQQAFGLVLKQCRQTAGLSQEKLALECELDRTYISLLERGLRTPTLHTIFVLADHLGVSPVSMVKAVKQQLD